MRKLNVVKSEIELEQTANAKRVNALQSEATKIFEKMMNTKKKKALVQKLVNEVETSKDLTNVEDEFFHQWIRADFSGLIDLDDQFQRDLLVDYLQSNFYVNVNFKDECLTYSIGHCIIVNEDGDVLDQDSSEWFLSKSDYESKEERNALIEAYMEKSGCFPSVVSVDRYGNAFYINTQPQKKAVLSECN